MTAQIPDTVIYEGEEYEIVGVKGTDLPSPSDFGMKPQMISTACYRGYYAQYTCRDGALALTELTLRAPEYKPVNGVKATFNGSFGAGQYVGINVPVPFSGGLLLAKDFIGSMYVHMGFQKPTSFETVIELIFEDGKLQQVVNHSEKMAVLREDMRKPRPRPGYDDPGLKTRQLQDWITWTFSLDYDL